MDLTPIFSSDTPEMSRNETLKTLGDKLVILPPDLEIIALKYADLNETKSSAEKEMKSIRQELIDFTGPSFKGRTEKLDLNVSYIEASTTIDGGLLKQLHPEIYLSTVKSRAAYTILTGTLPRPGSRHFCWEI